MLTQKQKSYPEGDYVALAEALEMTPRGRWFLEQYVARNAQGSAREAFDKLSHLAHIVSHHETAQSLGLSSSQLSLINQALEIVRNSLNSKDANALGGATHDVEKSASMLEQSAEKLLVSAANLKMGKITESIFAEVLEEAERVEDARALARGATSKLTALYDALILLETHLVKCLNNAPEVPSSTSGSSQNNFEHNEKQKSHEREEKCDIAEHPISQTADAPASISSATEAKKAFSTNESLTSLDQASPTTVSDETKSAKPAENDDDNHDDDSSNGDSASDSPQGEEMSAEDIDALFACEIAQDDLSTHHAMNSEELNKTNETAKEIAPKVQKTSALRQKTNSLLRHIAEQQFNFFAHNPALSFRSKIA